MCHATSFSARALKKNIFFDVDIVVKKQIEMWFSEVCTLIDNATYHDSGQKLLWTCEAQLSESTTSVMTHVIVNKSTDHTKPHLIC